MSHAAFLADIAANPFNADARLVYADWLEGQGDEAGAAVLRSGMIPLCDLDRAAVDGMARLRMYGRDSKFIQSMRDKTRCTACAGEGKILATWRPKQGFMACQRCNGKGPVNALTPAQYRWLWVLCHRYRRQMKDQQVMDEAARRYELYCEMLDIHTKPKAQRHTTRKMDMGITLFD